GGTTSGRRYAPTEELSSCSFMEIRGIRVQRVPTVPGAPSRRPVDIAVGERHYSCDRGDSQMNRYRALCACAPLLMAATAATAVAQQPTDALTVQQLAPNVYEVIGGGGNSGVLIGTDGVVVIDAKTSAASGKELLD